MPVCLCMLIDCLVCFATFQLQSFSHHVQISEVHFPQIVDGNAVSHIHTPMYAACPCLLCHIPIVVSSVIHSSCMYIRSAFPIDCRWAMQSVTLIATIIGKKAQVQRSDTAQICTPLLPIQHCSISTSPLSIAVTFPFRHRCVIQLRCTIQLNRSQVEPSSIPYSPSCKARTNAQICLPIPRRRPRVVCPRHLCVSQLRCTRAAPRVEPSKVSSPYRAYRQALPS